MRKATIVLEPDVSVALEFFYKSSHAHTLQWRTRDEEDLHGVHISLPLRLGPFHPSPESAKDSRKCHVTFRICQIHANTLPRALAKVGQMFRQIPAIRASRRDQRFEGKGRDRGCCE